VQYSVVEIDDVLALAEPLTSELPAQSRIALPLSQHPGRAKLRRLQRANLVGIAFNRRPSTPSGWQAGEGPRISHRCGDVREAGRGPAPPRASASGNTRCWTRRRVLAGYMNKTALHGMAEEPPVPPVKILPGARVLLLTICLPEIDLLSRPEDSALPGHYI
jgi:hypothetical protein